MLPIGAAPVPVLVTVIVPLTTSWPAIVAPLVAVIVHVTVDVDVLTAPVLASVQLVSLVCCIWTLESVNDTPAVPPPSCWLLRSVGSDATAHADNNTSGRIRRDALIRAALEHSSYPTTNPKT